jgi:hypothetical protein
MLNYFSVSYSNLFSTNKKLFHMSGVLGPLAVNDRLRLDLATGGVTGVGGGIVITQGSVPSSTIGLQRFHAGRAQS